MQVMVATVALTSSNVKPTGPNVERAASISSNGPLDTSCSWLTAAVVVIARARYKRVTMIIVAYMARGRSFVGLRISSTELPITAKPVNAKNVSARLPRMGVVAGQVSTDNREPSAKVLN